MPDPAPLIFLDTETCGLDLSDPIWDVALIRREPDGTETEHQFFVAHDVTAAEKLPESFQVDHDERYKPAEARDISDVAVILNYLMRPTDGVKAHVVGAVPNFDTERIAHQFGISPWHYHLVDVEAMAAGSLGIVPPWDSDDIAARVGVLGRQGRHTALGDARWAKAIFDAVIGAAKYKEDKKA